MVDISVLLQPWYINVDKNWPISLSILFDNVDKNLKYEIHYKSPVKILYYFITYNIQD